MAMIAGRCGHLVQDRLGMLADAQAAGARRDDKGGSEARLTILFVRHTNTKDSRLPRVCQQRGRMKGASTNDRLGDPKHAARATRTAGRQMRSRLLDAASRLFKERGLAAVSIADIAATADAFPSQISITFAPRRPRSAKPHAVTCFTWRERPSNTQDSNSRRRIISARWSTA